MLGSRAAFLRERYIMVIGNKSLNEIDRAAKALQQGGVVVYPTEGVYGLGCDPFNETAVLRLLKIKNRRINKGLILIASDWKQVEHLIKWSGAKYPISTSDYPTTWIFPADDKVPRWIAGKFSSVAIRVTTHPAAKRLCQKFGGPIVSSSANLSGKRPIRKSEQISKKIICSVDFVVSHEVGNLGRPTRVCDAKTGKVFRA